jgi:glutaredoxin
MRRWLLALLLVGAPALARAQVYSWTDKEGTLHFGDAPPGNGEKARQIDLPAEAPPLGELSVAPPKDGRAGDAAKPLPAPPAASTARPAARARSVTSVELFTTSWCPWCKKARAYFAGQGIAVIERDIETDGSALARKLALDGDKRVPTVVIGGKVVRGYAPAQYQAALAQP